MNKGKNNNTTKRPPVVVVMGHIDHGKSTLLDYIRKTKVVDSEAGGITQHVGAYEADYTTKDGVKHSITFLDTPGHAAFYNIRERGAQSADIAILIVSGEDGVKPQTIEAYNDIKAANIPFVVAITKIDKPNANIDKAKTSLGENEIYVEGWGGDIPCVAISAITGEGIPELLEMIILISEMANLTTNNDDLASGTIIESTLDTKKGISATLLLKNGSLKTGLFVVSSDCYCPVRFIENFKGEKIDHAIASMPVQILGWNKIPPCGATWQTVQSKKIAESMIEEFIEEQTKNNKNKKPSNQNNEDENTIKLPVIIKTDVIGSLEGIKHELSKLKHDKVKIKIVSEGIGDINENDIKTAMSDPGTIILGFNSKPDKKTSQYIERLTNPINVKVFSIIYELAQFVEEELLKRIPKEYIEEVTGTAKILAIFSKEKDKQVIGGKVENGQLENGNDVRIMRRGSEIGKGKIRELQSKKVRVSEVKEGFEFGVMVEAKNEIAVGDRIESVKIVEKK